MGFEDAGDLPELTVDQLAAMGPDQREMYEMLLAMSPAERVQFAGQQRIVAITLQFFNSVCTAGDLASVWDLLHPDLQDKMVSRWVEVNSDQIVEHGMDPAEIERTLGPDHPVWSAFERAQVVSFRELLADLSNWNVGTETRLVAPDIELLYLYHKAGIVAGILQPGPGRQTLPVLLKLVAGAWLILDIGSETPP